MTHAPKTVSILGVGLRGSALAEALLAAGHKVTVWNRTAAKAAPLVANGADGADTAGAALSASDVSILCVLDHAATMDVLHSVPSGVFGGGKCLIVLTTMSPDQSAEAAAWATGQGYAYLEGSILGVPEHAVAGSATVVAAGANEAFAAVETVLRAFGGGTWISDRIGAAVTFDRVFYAYGYGALFAFLQGAAMAHAQGFPVRAFAEIVAARLPALGTHFSLMSAAIAARDHSVTQCRADVWAEGFARTLALCRELDVDDSLPAAIMQLWPARLATGDVLVSKAYYAQRIRPKTAEAA